MPTTFLNMLKFVALLAVVAAILYQLPELRYDLASRQPVRVSTPADLKSQRFGNSTYVTIHGRADLGKLVTLPSARATVFFPLQEYGGAVLVRTDEKADEDWKQYDRWPGRLQPLLEAGEHERVRELLRQQHGLAVPDDAYVLVWGDHPATQGGQLASMALSVVALALVLYWIVKKKKRTTTAPAPAERNAEKLEDEGGEVVT